MRFFFDRCVPQPIAAMVRAVDGRPAHEIVYHDERFAKNTDDVDWLRALARDKPWVVISGDGKILTRRGEREVLEEVDLPYFVLDHTWLEMQMLEYAWRFMRVWPLVVAAARKPQVKNAKYRILGARQFNVVQF